MVTTYATDSARRNLDTSSLQPSTGIDAIMVVHGEREVSVPETVETPSPLNTGADLDMPPPLEAMGQDDALVIPEQVKGDRSEGDSILGLELTEKTDGASISRNSMNKSPPPLAVTEEGLRDAPQVSPPVDESEISVQPEEEYTPEYTAECLKTMEEFKKTQQEFSSRLGPPFRVADGEAFDRILRFLVKIAQEDFESAYKQCINFFQENLCPAFTKLYTDDGLSGWPNDIYVHIYCRSLQAIKLIALKMNKDYTGLLDLLAVLLTPSSRFMNVCMSRPSETYPTVILPPGRLYSSSLFPTSSTSDFHKASDSLKAEEDVIPPDVYARCYETRNPRGYLVDYLNVFGRCGGFDAVQARICNASDQNPLTISLLVALLKPFGNCADYLTKRTVEQYFQKIFQVVCRFLESMTDEDFKKESGKQDGKTDPVTTILRSLKLLAKAIPEQCSNISQAIEVTRLSSIMKLLKVSTYNGKMHALNEINKIIQSLTYTHRPFQDDDSALGAEKVAKWLMENRLLSIILSDSMHQPQYVEKLDKIIRFLIREKCLTLQDLDDIWAAQSGKHEAIVKNVHDLLTKLAWDFTPAQLDHLFGHFQGSWVSASRRQREKLLELIRRLAEDDKEGVMAVKVLDLLWSLCHNDELPAEIMDQALAAHLKIIDYACTQDRDSLKMTWLRKCMEEISQNNWVIPALRHIKNICDQYPEQNNTLIVMGGSPRNLTSRAEVLAHLIEEKIVDTVISSLEQYLHQVQFVAQHNPDPSFDPMTQDLLGSKFSHYQHVDERLTFLRYVLQQGNTYLQDANVLWRCLAEQPVFESDRDLCFQWFCKLMSAEDPDLKSDIINDFYNTKVLQLDPSCLTDAGLKCFRAFLCHVNTKEGKLEHKRKQYFLHQFDLIGIEYLWKVILTCKEDISQLGIDLLRDLYSLPTLKMQSNITNLHHEMITECVDRLRPIRDNLDILKNDQEYHDKILGDANKAVRILRVISEYVQQFDKDYDAERLNPPLSRATYGTAFVVVVKSGSVQPRSEDVEIWTHTNETIRTLRRMLYQKYRISPSAVKMDLFYNNELLSPQQDRRLITDLGFDYSAGHVVLTVKFGGPAMYGHGILPDMAAHSSPESSNDVSPVDTPLAALAEETNIEKEDSLPGVYISRNPVMMEIFVHFADLGSRLENRDLLNAARDLLSQLPADANVIASIQEAAKDESIELDNLFHEQSPSKILYTLQVFHSLILPSRLSMFETCAIFCADFMSRRPLMDYILNMLTRNKFAGNVDAITQQQWCQVILHLVKIVLHVMHAVGVEVYSTCHPRNSNPHQGLAANMQAGLRRGFPEDILLLLVSFRQQTPPQSDVGARMLGQKVGQMLRIPVINLPKLETLKALRHVAWTAASGSLHLLDCPETDAHSAIQKDPMPLDQSEIAITDEAIDCLMLCFPLTPKSVDNMITQKELWLQFLEDTIIICKEQSIRRTTMQHFAIIGAKCTNDHQPLDTLLIAHFFHCIQKESKIRPETCDEVFRFVASLLNSHARPLHDAEGMLKVEMDWLALCRRLCSEGGRQDIQDTLLEGHLLLIKEIIRALPPTKKDRIRTKENRPLLIQELIEDFLFPTARILFKMANQRHNSLSSRPTMGPSFNGPMSSSSSDLFDAAYSDPLALLDMPSWARPICQTTASITAAFDVILALCYGSADNLMVLNETLTLLFYSDNESPITEWEYSPPVGPRRTDGFVGLKNAGATCYMNSVLQQLYMVPNIRSGILTIEGVANSYADDELDEKGGEGDGPNNAFVGPLLPFGHVDDSAITGFGDQNKPEPTEIIPYKAPSPAPTPLVAQDYNAGLIKQMQVLFSHLACSKLQFFVPRGFWKHFRMGGEQVNLREQHDAFEFYNSVVDCVNEGLKSGNKSPLMSEVLGGTFSDQKICRDCPHRYSKETFFNSISLDIRNFHTLQESMENYVKGDILEGTNAYHCEKCDRKVDTIKRLCVKTFPPMMVFQLKRFDYDWEREQSIKFNDYFEFPREVDLEPYTAAGLAKVDGITVESEEDLIREVQESTFSGSAGIRPKKPMPSTLYRLVGIVVHSGQAAGGHYYSFILDRDGEPKWYRFDDGDVTECKIDDDDELKAQCFGEELPGQKRWWNAYLLFYERIEPSSRSPMFRERERPTGRIRMQSESIGAQVVHMIPHNLRNIILKQNLKFVHNRSQFIPEYFIFLKHLLLQQSSHLNNVYTQSVPNAETAPSDSSTMAVPKLSADLDMCAFAVVQLLGKFIFDVCFRTRRTVRGPANEWSDAFIKILFTSSSSRIYFTENVLFKNHRRIFDYLLECPSQDIRNAFSRVLAHLAFYGKADRPCLPSTIRAASLAGYKFPVVPESLEELVMRACMSLMERREISDHSRHIGSFFNIFAVLITGDDAQKETLIKLGVPELLIKIAVDDGPYPLFKYNVHTDIGRLCTLVSNIMLFIDFDDIRRSSQDAVLQRNPYGIDRARWLAKASPELCQLFMFSHLFFKRLIDDALQAEDVKTAIKYLCWENPDFTQRVLCVLLNSLGIQYVSDVRQLMEFTISFIQLEDSWVVRRLDEFLFGLPSESVEGFLNILYRNRMSNPRRAYLLFKIFIQLMANQAVHYLLQNEQFREMYMSTCDWLQQELRGSGPGGNRYYNNSATLYNTTFSWNNQMVISNESSNSSQFERTDSARDLAEKAMEYLPEDAETNSPAINPSYTAEVGDEEEEDDDAIGFEAKAFGSPGLGQTDDIQDDQQRGMDDDHWGSGDYPTAGMRANYVSGSGFLGSSHSPAGPSHYKSSSFTSSRRNGAIQDEVKENLMSSGLLHHPIDPTAFDDGDDDSDVFSSNTAELNSCMRNLKLSDPGKTISTLEAGFRPGTPVSVGTPAHGETWECLDGGDSSTAQQFLPPSKTA